LKGGAFHKRLDAGFSTMNGVPVLRHAATTRASQRTWRLPMRTRALSFSDRSGKPQMSGGSSPRSGGGCPHRARDHDAHGMPAHTRLNSRRRMREKIESEFKRLRTSSDGSRSISNDSAVMPRSAYAQLTRQVPPKSSSTRPRRTAPLTAWMNPMPLDADVPSRPSCATAGSRASPPSGRESRPRRRRRDAAADEAASSRG
jgi:hypothetical protein